ncbi:hypothetical protein [Marivibrio halodurans]
MAYAAAVLLLSTVLWSAPAMADPSIDAGSGVAAYEAGDYARAHDLLKPAAEAGDIQARYLMARLLTGDLPASTDFQLALGYLDERTRCYNPASLNLYGYSYPRAHGESVAASRHQILAYKEAMLAGNLRAAFNLGKTVTEDFDRPFIGASYIWEASEKGHAASRGIVEGIKRTEHAVLTEQRITEIIENEPPELRWPTLNKSARMCPRFTVLQAVD